MRNIDELGSLADIFVCAPCNAGKNLDKISAGFLHFKTGAISRVIRKYGSCK